MRFTPNSSYNLIEYHLVWQWSFILSNFSTDNHLYVMRFSLLTFTENAQTPKKIPSTSIWEHYVRILFNQKEHRKKRQILHRPTFHLEVRTLVYKKILIYQQIIQERYVINDRSHIWKSYKNPCYLFIVFERKRLPNVWKV